MFRRRLQFALGTLAVAALLQGAVAWWAIDVASTQVHRGRIASDVLNAVLELSASKQRLRQWATQSWLGPGADPALRDRLLADMSSTLERIDGLSRLGATLHDDEAARDELRRRAQALQVLRQSLRELRAALQQAHPSTATPPPSWDALNRMFDTTQGQDLRTLLAESIAREQVAVSRERAAADRSLRLVSGLALGTTLALGLGAALLSLHFARALRQPLDALRSAAEALRAGDLSHRIGYTRVDEFGEVARTMNGLAAQLAEHQRREADARQRLEGLVQVRTAELQTALHDAQLQDARRRQLFADISHELRTPTTAIRGEAEIALRGADKPVADYQLALDRIADASRHLGHVIDDLLTLARHDLDDLGQRHLPLSPLQPLDEALEQAQAAAHRQQVRLRCEGDTPTDTQVLGDAMRLRQLFGIVLDNAIGYSAAQGEVVVRHGVDAEHPTGPMWWVKVIDRGVGIPADELPQVSQRHFRGSAARRLRPQGQGLGLAIARALIKAHGGGFDLDSTPGEGTEVVILLPVLTSLEEAQGSAS